MGLQTDQQPLLQQQQPQPVQPVQQQQPQQQEQQFVGYPPQYAYAVPYPQTNYTGSYNAPPPPGFYQGNTFQPNPVVITTSHSSHCRDSSADITGALIIFIGGFFLSCIWLAAFMYLKSTHSTARFLSIASITLFFISLIVAIIVISVMLSAPTYYYSYSSESSSYY
ncbi:hypothetical protein DLAC_00449 [Tieghemostelium lacteum]|uniref:Transmembrane protein n=1 Tax=Tieghemostelium lacteum TaxID=361077 RepID=A0A152A9R8_TIELA|nr:hypothetical protein DLAC_00449 [Tieghemostelium lacteum]|eukprot:KYR02966.1 hypothetical protein DLAC_00449 [Tieghemostelium lacteum]